MSLASIFNRFRRPSLSHVRVVMYTRQGCHLCDSAWQILQQAQQRHGFPLEAIDVDMSADLVAQHGSWVPVVTVNGTLRFRGAVNRVLLQRLLDAASKR